MHSTTFISLCVLVLLAGCGSSPNEPAGSSGGAASTSTGAATTTATASAEGTTAASPADGSSSSDTGADSSGSIGQGEGGMCSMFEQDCQEGLKCMPRMADGGKIEPACLPINGTAVPGDVCSHDGIAAGTDDCDADGMCMGVFSLFAPWEGTCRPFCGGTEETPTCTEPSDICTGQFFPLCFAGCDPLAQGCTGPGEGCYYFGAIDTFVCMALGNEGQIGESCSFGNCSAGLQCWNSDAVAECDSGGCCTEYCDVTEPNTCTFAASGAECVPVGTGGPGLEDVGLCLLPQ
ncbi:MAG: hypothetical protein AAF799_17180 [Myxococcota bacterium]